MRKAILYLGMSLDGMIADEDGGVGWMGAQDAVDDTGFGTFVETVDTVLMGANTYRQIVTELSPNVWPYEGLNCYVWARQKMDTGGRAHVVEGDIGDFVGRLKRQEGRDIWICGGANIARQLIQRDVIDEYRLSILPVLLGSGIPLFQQGLPCLALQLRESRRWKNTVELVYERIFQRPAEWDPGKMPG